MAGQGAGGVFSFGLFFFMPLSLLFDAFFRSVRERLIFGQRVWVVFAH